MKMLAPPCCGPDGPNVCGVQLKDEFAIHGVLFLEDTHVKVLQINLPGELLGTSSLLGLRTTIEILQVHVIMEKRLMMLKLSSLTGDKALLGEVGIHHDEIADRQELFAYS